MSEINLKLKSYDELIFEITTLNTNKYLLEQKVKNQKEVLDKIKEYIENNKYKKMGGYGDNEDEDIEVCLFEDDIWKLEELLEEIE